MKLLLKFLNSFEKAVITISMGLMVIFISLQVFSRHVLSDAFSWTEEASRYLFIWLIFLSIGISFIEKKHISIDIVMDRVPSMVQKVLQQFVYLLLIALSIFLLVQGIDLVEKMQSFNQRSATLQIPMWTVYAALPTGFLFAILRLIQASVLLYREDNDDESEKKEVPIG